MSRSPSIVESVVRAHVTGLLLAALAIVVVGGAVGGVVIVARDDASAIALARTLGSELENHADDSPAAIDVIIREERQEQRWFARRTEVFRDGVRLGSDDGSPSLAPYLGRADGCSSADIRGDAHRLCVVHERRSTVILVASPLAPMLAAVLPLAASIALAALMTAIVFAFVGARVVRRRLAPLRAFESALGELPPFGSDRQVKALWGAAEVDALAATFNTLLSRIDDAVTRERRFVADAAHELRTPLTRLRGQLELAMDEMKDGARPDQRLSAAARSCRDIARTTEALLALARDEIVRDDVVNLADVVREQRAALEGRDAERLELSADDEVLVRGDETLLALAIRNLVDNAMKYTDDAVTIEVRSRDGMASVLVEDRGAGIAEAELERVCEPFVRGTVLGKTVRGSGLGLALTRHVAALHDGTLALRNRPQRGLAAELRMERWRASPG